jgi:ferritin-like metal-binding protein YciE
MAPKEMTKRDAKVVQYLNDAYATERRLEIALEGHIAMTPRADYKKRLGDHLLETKAHARLVARRIQALGGEAETMSLHVPESLAKGATGAMAVVQRAAAAAQAPLHAVRGTGEQERMLKNARTEYQDEAEEIATYRAIEALATAVGDKETAKLAREIGREEKRMADFLVDIIDQLALDVVHDEVPALEIGTAPAARLTSRPTATPRAKPTTTPRAEGTTAPRAKATTRPRAKATTAPRAKATTAPRAKATTTPRAKATTTPRAKATTKPRAKATTKPRAKATTTSRAKATTTSRAKATTTPRAKATTTQAKAKTTRAKAKPASRASRTRAKRS